MKLSPLIGSCWTMPKRCCRCFPLLAFVDKSAILPISSMRISRHSNLLPLSGVHLAKALGQHLKVFEK
jgi:hypothetical protein